MAKENQLIAQPIPMLIRQIAIPASIGFFFNTMFNVVDTYFAGLISTQALASLSLSFPVYFIIIATGTGISTGVTALIANALGAGQREEAKLFAIQGIIFGFLMSIALTLLGLYGSPFLFRILGASDEYLATALSYMDTIFLGTAFFVSLYMLNAVLNGLGETRPFRNFLTAGCFLNIILDPWFMYGGLGMPALGIVGIALATVLIQAMGCVYLGTRVFRTGLISVQEMGKAIPRLRAFKEIARQGIPASVNMLSVGMGIFVITYFVSRFGKEAVAAYGIAMRVEQIVLVPTIGLNIATLTLVAQNHGARLFQRVRETLDTALWYGGVMMLAGTLAVFVLSMPFMSLFTVDSRVVQIGTTYLRIDALVLYAYVILFVHVAALQGMKKPMFAVWIGLYRQIIAPALLFWVFTRLFDFGLISIWWGIFSITWSAALFTILYARRVLSQHPLTSSVKLL